MASMADGILFIINWYWTQKIVEKRKYKRSTREVQEKYKRSTRESTRSRNRKQKCKADFDPKANQMCMCVRIVY